MIFYDKHSTKSSQVALDEYVEKYGSVESFELQQASLKQVIDELLRVEKNQITSKKASNGNLKSRLIGLITFVDRYAAAMDCLIQTCSGSVVNPAALIWGLIRILIEVWNQRLQQYDALWQELTAL